MRLYSLGSGSSGNGFALVTDEVALLIDCGTAIRSCQGAVRDLGIEHRLAGIVISHEHIDHVRAIPSILRKRDIPLVTTSGTFRGMRGNGVLHMQSAGQRFAESGVEITFVGVSHDAAEPCGFVVDADGMRVAVFTDLGIVTEDVIDSLSSADIIVLESNYDRDMLLRGGYPAHLKRRIQSPVGHLSNDDCATALVAAVNDRTRAIWLAHLSHNNNTQQAACSAATEALQHIGRSIPVAALPRYDRVEITNVPARQLTFGL